MDEFPFSDEQLRGLTPAQILQLRELHAGNVQAQNALAPVDHRMFTRDAAATGGPIAALAIGVASPFYQMMKALGVGKDAQTSDPSFKQFVEGYKGLGEGLMDWSKSKVKTTVKNPMGVGATDKHQAFLDNLRSLSPDDQRLFMAQQLSAGVPDTRTTFEHPGNDLTWPMNEQTGMMEMIQAERAKKKKLLEQPL